MRASSPTSRTSTVSRWIGPALAVLLILGGGLRAWYASAQLSGSRFYDERYSLSNVSAILGEARLEPANAYYPSLSFLPQTAVLGLSEGLYHLTGWQRLRIFDESRSDGFSATAYLLARLVSVAYGVLAIWLTFVVGRRLFSPAAGLLGAALLSATWAHVQASGIFKPDILVALLALVTFLWTHDAVLRPSARRYALAGLGVGLAAAAKYNGVGVAVPLAVAALYAGFKDRRQWGWLALAGGVSALTFVALNPYLSKVFKYAGRQQELYQGNASTEGASHWTMPIEEAAFLVRHHSVVIACCALAGCVWLIALWRRRSAAERLETLLLLGFVLGYSLFYASITELFRGQNYLPVLAFTSLLAAWAIAELWHLAGRRTARRRSPALAWILGLVLVAAASRFSVTAAYADVVPSTAELAARQLTARLQPDHRLRQVFYEPVDGAIRPFRAGFRMRARLVDRLPGVDAVELARADGEVFPAERLTSDAADWYVRRLADPSAEVVRIEPGFLEAHGPGLVLRLRGWPLAGERVPLAWEGDVEAGFQVDFSASLAVGEIYSLELVLPRPRRGEPDPFELTLGGEPLATWAAGELSWYAHHVTSRREWQGDGELRVRYAPSVASMPAPEGWVYRWRSPGGKGH